MTIMGNRFLRQAILAYKGGYNLLTIDQYILNKIVSPFFSIILFVTAAKALNPNVNLLPLLLGNAVIVSTVSSIWGVGTVFRNERNLGTLMYVIVSPQDHFVTMLSKSLIHSIDGLFTTIVGLVIGSIFFGISVTPLVLVNFLFALIVILIATTAFGMVIGSMGLVIRDLSLLHNTAQLLLLVFTGANYNCNILPRVLQSFAKWLPMTNGLIYIKTIAIGEYTNSLLIYIYREGLVGLIYAMISYFTIKCIVKVSITGGRYEWLG